MDNPAITLDQLTETQKEVAEVIGLENYIKLVQRFGGSKGIYIPKYSELLRPMRDQKIIEKFDGYNYDELAKEFDLSERSIRTIVSKIVRAERSKPMSGQVAFGDYEDSLK